MTTISQHQINSISISAREVRELGRQVGLELVSTLSREEALSALADERPLLSRWQEAGYAGEMAYMNRPPELFTNLDHFLPGCRSVLVVAAVYYQGPKAAAELQPRRGFGRVARYAWGRDYHAVLRERLTKLARLLEARLNSPMRSRIFADAVPLLERALARQAGLGFIGRNTLLIQPGIGSFSFLGEILLDVEVEPDPTAETVQAETAAADSKGCGGCRRCISRCPTGALVEGEAENGKLDSRRCISYLNIEKRTVLSAEEGQLLGDWVFGCDVCQDECPFNHRGVPETTLVDFRAAAGVGPVLDLVDLLGVRTAGEYRRRFAGTSLLRAKREQLLRNALCVLVNQRAFEALPVIAESLHRDPSELVRHHAKRALIALGPISDGIERARIERQLGLALSSGFDV